MSILPARADELRFGLPIACTPGKDCWLQNYVDHDAGPGFSDYACGRQSYDGHDGTDIRVLDTTSNADVIASAAGTVRAIRDGVADHLMKTEADRSAVAGIDCGNGVAIVHEDGWETQYCHLKRGSVAVKPGDRIAAGDRLGSVGYSGQAAFPHVHLSIRSGGQALDPFAPDGQKACGTRQSPLWTPEASASLSYRRGNLLQGGFAPGKVRVEDLETGGRQIAERGKPRTQWPAIVAYGWAINLEAGDEIEVKLDGPGDFDAQNRVVLDRSKATYLLFAGKANPPVPGEYTGSFTVTRDGKQVIAETWDTKVE